MRSRVAITVTVLLLGLALPAAVGARSPNAQPQSERARTMAYWTPARIANAAPRDFVKDSSGKLVPKAKPGGGGGSGAVTGASWNGNGIIERQSGRILFTMGGSDYICSGSVVDSGNDSTYSTVLSAGHCVFDAVDGWATNWMYIPELRRRTDLHLREHRLWLLDGEPPRRAYRIRECRRLQRPGRGGRLRVRAGRTRRQGHDRHAGSRRAVTGGYGLKTGGVTLASKLWAFGYPAAGRYKGKDLTYCTGTLVNDPYGADTWGMACNMTGGSSGGPWLADTTAPGTTEGSVASLNSYGYSGQAFMYGPKFTTETSTLAGDVMDGSATNGVSVLRTLP